MAQLIDTSIDGNLEVNGGMEVTGEGNINGTLNVTDGITIDGKNVITEKSAITVYKSATQTLTTSYAKAVMGTSLSSVGDAFELSDGGVLVKKDCTVEVSGHFYISGVTAGDSIGVQLWKDGGNYSTVSAGNKAATTSLVVNVSPILISVTAGAVLHLAIVNSTASRGTVNAYAYDRMTVKEV